MSRIIITIIASIIATLTLAFAVGLCGQEVNTTAANLERAPGCRIGVYDSRAIAIAYGGSKYNDVSDKMKEMQKAKAAGDQAKMKDLDAWGQKHQRQLHRQGFSRVPVTDLLEPVKNQLPGLAEKLGVSAIAFECNYTGPNVEKVDVTMDLVKLYEPSEKTMKWIKESMKNPPIDLDDANKSQEP